MTPIVGGIDDGDAAVPGGTRDATSLAYIWRASASSD